jgi:hypothetical protein
VLQALSPIFSLLCAGTSVLRVIYQPSIYLTGVVKPFISKMLYHWYDTTEATNGQYHLECASYSYRGNGDDTPTLPFPHTWSLHTTSFCFVRLESSIASIAQSFSPFASTVIGGGPWLNCPKSCCRTSLEAARAQSLVPNCLEMWTS